MNTINLLAFLFISHFLFPFNRGLGLTESAPHPVCKQEQKNEISVTANLVFKSADGGQTWQDISKGLPEPVEDNYSFGRNIFFSDENGLYVTAGNGIYHHNTNSTVPAWKKDILPYVNSSIAPGKARVFAFNYWSWGGILQKVNGTGFWLPVFTNFNENRIRSVFETAGGNIFICTDGGIYKSTNNGKSWKNINLAGSNVVERNGVLIATNTKGIMRSTDAGETWAMVISEGGVGIDVELIQGGIAAITYNSASKTRRIRASYDDGKSWQAIDAGLPGSQSISSIIQVGDNFFCGHPSGIFRSSDKGKTWKLLLPSVKDKVFKLSVSGNVIYAIPVVEGC